MSKALALVVDNPQETDTTLHKALNEFKAHYNEHLKLEGDLEKFSRRTAGKFIKAGHALVKVKEACDHGMFRRQCEALGLTESKATRLLIVGTYIDQNVQNEHFETIGDAVAEASNVRDRIKAAEARERAEQARLNKKAEKAAKEEAKAEKLEQKAKERELAENIRNDPEALQTAIEEEARRERKRRERKQRELDAKQRRALRESAAPSTIMEIVRADIRTWDVEPGSVDAVITDPPYAKDAIPLWRDLGEFASKVLRPNGVLVALTGSLYLPDIMAQLAETDMQYRWTCAYVMPGASQKVFRHNVHQQWKPLLIYSKGEHGRDWFTDIVTVPVRDEQESDLHPWQQQAQGFQSVVDRFASPGQLVCDPFVGNGTTAWCARERGCGFTGA